MIKLEVVVILFFRAHKVTIIFHIISINMPCFMLFNIKYLDIAILWKSSRNFFFVLTLACLKKLRTFAPLLTKSTSDEGVLERWQSGRLRRSWKPLKVTLPGVRIPPSPLENWNLSKFWGIIPSYTLLRKCRIGYFYFILAGQLFACFEIRLIFY